jgi:uncharacterized protein (DUF1330 family)
MKTYLGISVGMIAGMALGGFAVQGLNAQTKKAYSVTELELVDAAAQAAYGPLIQAAQKAAGGRPFNTAGGKVVSMFGTAPTRVAIIEWDSLDKAEAFFNSAAFKDLAPQRDKAIKTVRRYAVEAN